MFNIAEARYQAEQKMACNIYRKDVAELTHRDDVKEMLKWTHDRSWYGKDADNRYYLKKAAPPDARESFKKWAAYQDTLSEDNAIGYTLEIFAA